MNTHFNCWPLSQERHWAQFTGLDEFVVHLSVAGVLRGKIIEQQQQQPAERTAVVLAVVWQHQGEAVRSDTKKVMRGCELSINPLRWLFFFLVCRNLIRNNWCRSDMMLLTPAESIPAKRSLNTTNLNVVGVCRGNLFALCWLFALQEHSLAVQSLSWGPAPDASRAD